MNKNLSSDRRHLLPFAALILVVVVAVIQPQDLSAQENRAAEQATVVKKSVWDPSGWFWVHPEEPRRPLLLDVTHHRLRSAKMDRDVGLNVLVPPGYADSDRRYPVIYMLHGATGHEGCRGFAPLVQQLMLDGKVAPAIWVWPNGGQGSMWRDGPEGNPHRVYVDTFFIRELIPHIDANWRTIPRRESRALVGFSMGGYGSVRFAFKYPELFAACLSIAGGAFVPKSEEDRAQRPFDDFPASLAKRNEAGIRGRIAVRLIAGDGDFNYEPTRRLADALEEAGLPYEKYYPSGLTHSDLGKYFNAEVVAWLHSHVRQDGPVPPNIVLILADDLGFSDLGCYGGEIATPNVDRLAAEGVRFTQFYNCGRCCPTRASLLSGLYPHQAGVGHMLEPWRAPSYTTGLTANVSTIAERLRDAGYQSYHVGKWHVGGLGVAKPDDHAANHPLDRGFVHAFGTGAGGSYFRPKTLYRDRAAVIPTADFFATDAFTDAAVEFIEGHRREQAVAPFFLHLCYTAPHFPLHAPAEDIAKYRGRYQSGWDALRKQRFKRQKELGIMPKGAVLSPPHDDVVAWDSLSEAEQDGWDLRMSIYAAMIDRMDRGIGRVLDTLEKLAVADDTLVLFLSDNGASAEFLDRWPNTEYGHQPGLQAGAQGSHKCLEVGWANASNTPFREHKIWMHEGGIATPLVVRYPRVVRKEKQITSAVGHVIDLAPTLLQAANLSERRENEGRLLTPLEGRSLFDVLGVAGPTERTLAWEHEGNRALRQGRWKLVAEYNRPWELYDLQLDRTEVHDLAAAEPGRVRVMAEAWQKWADRVGVVPWSELPGSSYRPASGYRRTSETMAKPVP